MARGVTDHAEGAPPATSIRVVVVDDDAVVRRGLQLVLGGDSGVEIVGEAVDGLDAQRVVGRLRPDVVLMDLRMPHCDGITATGRLLTDHPELAVLVLTTFDADEHVLRALQVGARGFLLKDADPADLVSAVRDAARGRPVLAPDVLDRVMRLAARNTPLPRPEDEQALASLTPREREVAAAVAAGSSNADIAADFYVSVATVKTHVGRVMTKLGASSRVQVAATVHRTLGTATADRPAGGPRRGADI